LGENVLQTKRPAVSSLVHDPEAANISSRSASVAQQPGRYVLGVRIRHRFSAPSASRTPVDASSPSSTRA
jgi:hypothetical protein